MKEEKNQECCSSKERVELQDSITLGTASKGVALKAYVNFTDKAMVDEKLRGLLKTKNALEELGLRVGW